MKDILKCSYWLLLPLALIVLPLLIMDMTQPPQANHMEQAVVEQLEAMQADYLTTTDQAETDIKRQVFLRVYAKYGQVTLPPDLRQFISQLQQEQALTLAPFYHPNPDVWQSGEITLNY